MALRSQGDGGGAVAQVVAVDDDDVRECASGLFDLLQHVLCDVGQVELQDADGVAAVGDWGENSLAPCILRCQHQLLAAQDLVVGTGVQEDLIGTAFRVRCLLSPQ